MKYIRTMNKDGSVIYMNLSRISSVCVNDQASGDNLIIMVTVGINTYSITEDSFKQDLEPHIDVINE